MILVEKVLLTRKGFDHKQKRLEECLHLLHYVIPKRLKQAIEHACDLSENNEYGHAEMQKELLEAEVHRLETLLNHAKIIDKETINTSHVEIGTTVTLKSISGEGRSIVVELVSPAEVDLEHGRISTSSPLGLLLLGKKRKQIVTLTTASGKIAYKVVKIQQCDEDSFS